MPGHHARLRAVVLVGAAAALLVPMGNATAQTTADPRQGLAPGSQPGGAGAAGTGSTFTDPLRDAGTAALNMELLGEASKPAYTGVAGAFNQSNINSDLAFQGRYLFSGNYRGFGVYDVSDPSAPTLRTTVNCPGGQGDVSVVGDLLFMSTESGGRVNCTTSTAAAVFRGVRIFDISDPLAPRHVGGVQTCRGSHTHTVVEDPDDAANVYIYVSGTSSSVSNAAVPGGCPNPAGNTLASQLDADGQPRDTARFQVEVIKVPVAAPQDAAVVTRARLMADPVTGSPAGLWPGGNHGPGTQATSASNACHDITAYPAIGLAAGACQGNGILIDISNPADPVRIAEVTDPNFAYWHSATFNDAGTKVVFTDEWGGGGAPRCRATDPDNWGANAIFDIVETASGGKALEKRSYYKIPNVQTNREVCVAHNGNLVPVPGRDIMVQAWYEGGVSVFDFTDSSNPKEIAFFDRGPYDATFNHWGGYWSVYWYNGTVYGNEIFLGLDSWGLTPSDDLSANEIAAARLARVPELNAQAQEPIAHAPSFTLTRARFDQAARAGALSAEEAADVTTFVDRAERFAARDKRSAAATLRAKAQQLTEPAQQPLAQEMLRLASSL
jgi:hypothetical protein